MEDITFLRHHSFAIDRVITDGTEWYINSRYLIEIRRMSCRRSLFRPFFIRLQSDGNNLIFFIRLSYAAYPSRYTGYNLIVGL